MNRHLIFRNDFVSSNVNSLMFVRPTYTGPTHTSYVLVTFYSKKDEVYSYNTYLYYDVPLDIFCAIETEIFMLNGSVGKAVTNHLKKGGFAYKSIVQGAQDYLSIANFSDLQKYLD